MTKMANKPAGTATTVPAEEIRRLFSSAVKAVSDGEPLRAEGLLGTLLSQAPDHPMALHLAGVVALQQNKRAEALPLLEKSVAIDPRNPASQCDLGFLLTSAGRHQQAEVHLREALRLKSGFPEAQLNLGNLLRVTGRRAEAERAYAQAIGLRPKFAEALTNRAIVLLDLGRASEAEAMIRRALEQRPDAPELHNLHGRILDALGRLDDALAAHRKSIALDTRRAQSYAELATTLVAYGRRAEGIEQYRIALRIDPDRADLRRVLGKHLDEAATLVERESDYRASAPNSPARMHLGFDLAKAYEETGEHARALQLLDEANLIRRRSFNYRRSDSDNAFREIEQNFTAELFARHAGAGNPDATPIFIVGMPRSGTTLVEQILASHPDVAGAGELNLLRELVTGQTGGDATMDYARMLAGMDDADFTRLGTSYVNALRGFSSTARHITDKMPGNFMLIGMIKLMLPNARIIHCVRDAADTGISIYRNFFSTHLGYAYDLGEIGHYHRLYQSLMRHWNDVLPGFVHDVSYEALVADQEGETRRLLELCGLDFRPECLEFFNTERPVHTASAAQVRKPISAASVGIAKRYGAALAPLEVALSGQ
jgi:tetratricopeptide (TPR) repeat protein